MATHSRDQNCIRAAGLLAPAALCLFLAHPALAETETPEFRIELSGSVEGIPATGFLTFDARGILVKELGGDFLENVSGELVFGQTRLEFVAA